MTFEDAYRQWLANQIAEERNFRRRALLEKGLNHSTETFLRTIWYPAIGNLSDLHAEYEVRDLDNKCRYLDLAYTPNGLKGCVEIQDYRSHARDIEAARFKDLCMKQTALVLDGWTFLPIAYLSIRDDPAICRKLVLSFVGKFLSINVNPNAKLTWSEAESLRFALRLHRPFNIRELSQHLILSEHRTRSLLRSLVTKRLLIVESGKQRYRSYRLHDGALPHLG